MFTGKTEGLKKKDCSFRAFVEVLREFNMEVNEKI